MILKFENVSFFDEKCGSFEDNLCSHKIVEPEECNESVIFTNFLLQSLLNVC